MKARGNSRKKVVDSGDTIDQQTSEPMEIDAERAVTNGRGKLKEDGFFDGKSGINKYMIVRQKGDCKYL